MCVNLAAQVLSHSVADGMQTLCCFGKTEEATHTAQFIDKFEATFKSHLKTYLFHTATSA